MRRERKAYKMIKQLLQSLFVDKLMSDERQPVWEFKIPGVEGNFGLFAPQGELWKQLAFVRNQGEKRHTSTVRSVFQRSLTFFFSFFLSFVDWNQVDCFDPTSLTVHLGYDDILHCSS